ncbi:hypothetical protein pipiens_003320 [Culex pipiens pipiens]|uniref:Uncharacterized protein n=1 Tax=Culex pipiens pipiens TaxID=38569 RepID=A0ABD1D079_CULPP
MCGRGSWREDRHDQIMCNKKSLKIGRRRMRIGKLAAKICTPFNKRITLPPEHFKQIQPLESKFEGNNDSYRHSLPSYDANRFDGSQSTAAALHPVSSHTYPISSAVDSNSIMFRSNADDLHELDRLRATPSLYSRLSGSIQNLFVGGRGQSGVTVGGARSDFSKSENNLSELSRRRGPAAAGPRKDRLFFFGSRGKERQRRSNNFNTSGGGSFFTYNYDDEEESRWKKYFNFKMNLLRKHNKGKVDSGSEASKSCCFKAFR